jgi:3-deoxy-D-manno-octulosonic-acid transferase
MPLLYDLGIRLYYTGVRSAAGFKPKARAWVEGREQLWKRIEEKRDALRGCLWMHCASVGEFEQGRPVLEALKREKPELPILLTFFSPSGYEACKHSPLATHVDYLPLDTRRNAQRLITLLRPKAVLWVRYEFWLNHLEALRKAGVPTFLLSGIFRKSQPFFQWYGTAWRRMVRGLDHVFVQDEVSRSLLAGIGVQRVTVSGDTRFDRVAEIVRANEELPIAKSFRGNGPVLVCGSTWPGDEDLLKEAFSMLGHAPKCLVAPHELNDAGLSASEQRFPKPLVRWSELEGATATNIADILGPEVGGTLLVDRMGLLARLYRYGDLTYVGGGFGDGIHSLLEPAAWGSPVIFGPRHTKFEEARGLIACGGGFEVRDANQLRDVLQQLLKDPARLEQASRQARLYVAERCGATQRAMEHLRSQVL